MDNLISTKIKTKSNYRGYVFYVVLVLMVIFGVVYFIFSKNPIFIILTFAVMLFQFVVKKISYKNRNKQSDNYMQINQLLNEIPYSKPLQEQIISYDYFQKIPEPIAQESQVIIQEEAILDKDIVKILKPTTIVHKEPVYNKPILPEKYLDMLFQDMTDNGLSIDKHNLYELFAAMSTSKLILIRNTDPIIAERVIELYNSFIGSSYSVDQVSEDTIQFDDLFKEDYQLSERIINASESTDMIHMMIYRGMTISKMEELFQPLIDFSYNPLVPFYLNNYNITDIKTMPDNLWFFVILKDESPTLSEKLALSAVMLEFNAKIIEPLEEVVENERKLSSTALFNIFTKGYETKFLDEATWKGLDHIEAFFKHSDGFSLDNRLYRQIERFTSTYILFGGEKKDAIDGVLYLKLLNVFSLIKLRKTDIAEEDLLMLFEKEVGLEYLVKSKIVIKQIQDQIE